MFPIKIDQNQNDRHLGEQIFMCILQLLNFLSSQYIRWSLIIKGIIFIVFSCGTQHETSINWIP